MDEVTTKACTKCGVVKPLMDFSPQKKMRDGRRSWCKACCSARANAWNKANPEKHRAGSLRYIDRNRAAINARKRAQHDPVRKRAKTLRSLYGLTLADFDALLSAQGGRCAICRTDTPGGRHGIWHVDHDHQLGHVRGLLCDGCNRALGFFRDSVPTLRSAIAYLTRTAR